MTDRASTRENSGPVEVAVRLFVQRPKQLLYRGSPQTTTRIVTRATARISHAKANSIVVVHPRRLAPIRGKAVCSEAETTALPRITANNHADRHARDGGISHAEANFNCCGLSAKTRVNQRSGCLFSGQNNCFTADHREQPRGSSRARRRAPRTVDGGVMWTPINKGLRSGQIPDDDAEVGHCVHRIAMYPSNPQRLCMQKHWDVMRSDDGGDHWHEISGNLPSDFGFPIDVHAHEPNTIYVVPITSDAHHFPPEGELRVYRSRTGGDEWEALTNGLPQQDCYVNVLRDAMAVDTRDSCGINFGTTGGQLFVSTDSGDHWDTIVHDLPAVLSVEVQTWS